MLASAHSVSENGAPTGGFESSQKGAIDYGPGAEVGSFKRALHYFENQVVGRARFAVDGMRCIRLPVGRVYTSASN